MVMDPVMSFDPIRILQQLSADGVELVLIGGIAGRVHGSPTVTNDLDICYRRTKANCGRLANTLRELGAAARRTARSASSTSPTPAAGSRASTAARS
jgi:hypothetical protein